MITAYHVCTAQKTEKITCHNENHLKTKRGLTPKQADTTIKAAKCKNK